MVKIIGNLETSKLVLIGLGLLAVIAYLVFGGPSMHPSMNLPNDSQAKIIQSNLSNLNPSTIIPKNAGVQANRMLPGTLELTDFSYFGNAFSTNFAYAYPQSGILLNLPSSQNCTVAYAVNPDYTITYTITDKTNSVPLTTNSTYLFAKIGNSARGGSGELCGLQYNG